MRTRRAGGAFSHADRERRAQRIGGCRDRGRATGIGRPAPTAALQVAGAVDARMMSRGSNVE